MKNLKLIAGMVLIAALAALALFSRGKDANDARAATSALTTLCPVSGDKLGGDMGKPVIIVYQGQEVKFCCADCKPDFDKDPAKYMAKIRAADKPDKK
jgi:YHS domain-containing protein